jgi:hypothetical protein
MQVSQWNRSHRLKLGLTMTVGRPMQKELGFKYDKARRGTKMDQKFFLNSREIKDKNQSEDSLKMVKTFKHTDKKRDYYYHR